MDFTRSSQSTQKGKIHFAIRPLELSEPHKSTLAFNTQTPTRLKCPHRDPSGARELAAGEGPPELGNKRHLAAIRHTRARLGCLVWPERSLTGGGDGAG
jgi:hypothetical protein